MKIWIVWLLALPFLACAQETISPQEIQAQLEDAEAQYHKAKKMFSPWYTGPLITPGAGMMPVGVGNTQPYVFVVDNYAAYDQHRNSISLPSNLVQLKATANIQTGVTDTFDFSLNMVGQGNWQYDHSGGGFGDMSVVGGFPFYKQTMYVPDIKFTVSQTFPTGQYKKLNTNGFNLNGVGAGAYSTQFGLGVAKIIFWTTKHPMNVRCFFGYQLSTVVDVRGFNTYGGGFGCKGRVHPGNQLSADFGYELSLTEQWVAAIDVVYTATNRTKFHGNPGVLANGTPSAVGTGYSDNLSLAPALEYNFNPNIALIAGVQFSVYGRNSLDFVSGIVSFTYTFP